MHTYIALYSVPISITCQLCKAGGSGQSILCIEYFCLGPRLCRLSSWDCLCFKVHVKPQGLMHLAYCTT